MSNYTDQISIFLNLSVPDMAPIELTNSLLYHPDLNKGNKLVLNKLPYFTSKVKYPLIKLKILPYKKIVKFFFYKNYFESKLREFSKETNNNKNYNNDNIKNIDDDKKIIEEDLKKHNIYMYNVNVMLYLLFPTTFPSNNNVVTSYNEYMLKNKGDNILSTFNNNYIIKSPANGFSYLNINGNKYTILKVTLLNDILNNPTYNEIIDKYLNYKLWINENQYKTNKEFENNFKKLKERMQIQDNTSTKKDESLTITNTIISAFENNIPDEYNSRKKNSQQNSQQTSQQGIRQDFDKLNYYETLNNIVDKLTEINETKIKNIDNIDDILSKINDINELYNKLTSNSRITLKGIPPIFKTRLNKLNILVKSLSISNKILFSYMSSDSANLNYEEDDPDVIKVLKEKYTTYTEFVDNIKKFISPVRLSSNPYLQNIIYNYTKNIKEDSKIKNKNDVLLFEEVLEKINYELIYLNKLSYFSNKDNMKYLDTGVSIINIGKHNVPHIEIQLGINVVEGEYNSSNINKVKCKYRGLYLGKQTELYFNNQSIYDYTNFNIFLSKSDIEDTTNSLDQQNNIDNPPPHPSPSQPPSPPPPIISNDNTNIQEVKKGGDSKTRKYYKNKTRNHKTNKTYKYRK